MTNVVNYIRRKPKQKLNILTFPTHLRYETELAKTGHNFYAAYVKGMPPVEDYGLENYHLMPHNQFYPYDRYDLILSQNRFGQFGLAAQVNEKLQVPIITLEHTVPTVDLDQHTLHSMGKMVGDVNVFITNYSNEAWSKFGIRKNNNVIHHSVDTETFKPRTERIGKYVLTVANDYKARDYCLNYNMWKEINDSGGHLMKVIGNNSNDINDTFISEGDSEKLAVSYSECQAYLNTTRDSPMPMSLLEAMACECPIVTTDTCGISEFIQDGVNAIVANTSEEASNGLSKLAGDPEYAKKLGRAARETILEKCSSDRFVREWNEIFTKTYEASL